MNDPSIPATDEQAITMMLYAAVHRDLSLAVDAAQLIARSPHWIGGREIAIVDFVDHPSRLLYALFDLREDHDGVIRRQAVDIIEGRVT